jgi:hypothetical protein
MATGCFARRDCGVSLLILRDRQGRLWGAIRGNMTDVVLVRISPLSVSTDRPQPDTDGIKNVVAFAWRDAGACLVHDRAFVGR